MILPDVNVLVHAYNAGSPHHEAAKGWWEDALNDARPVALAWAAILGFVRITTHPRVFERPLRAATACKHARRWLAQPQVLVVQAGERHGPILFGLLEQLGTAGNLASDAHLAALAIEHQAELYSTDADFSRFPGLRWQNPLE